MSIRLMRSWTRLGVLLLLCGFASGFSLRQHSVMMKPTLPCAAAPILLLRAVPEPDHNNNNESAKPRVQFSNVISPVDSVLTWITSDVGSIVLGGLGLGLVVLGNWVLSSSSSSTPITDPPDAGQATRSNLLAVMATGAVLLNGLTKLDVESALADTVVLTGTTLPEPVGVVDDNNKKWVLESLLYATPAETVVVLQRHNDNQNSSAWKITAMAGTIPEPHPVVGSSTPILDRTSRTASETYLPTLQALPGRTEFAAYLPVNTQAALLVPVPDRSTVLVLGSNRARSFTPRDMAWCRAVVTRLQDDDEFV